MRFTRRRALLALSTLTAAPALGASATAPSPEGPRFDHGVASGDPLSDRVIIWSRLSGADKPTEVTWQVATDVSFNNPVAQGRFITDAGRDYTIKADVIGLSPDTSYLYRFKTKEALSPIGHTRTLAMDTDKVILAVVSCSLHPNGYFNAYRAIAEMERVDAVIHLGDYIYEYGAGLSDYGMGNGRLLGRTPEPPHEIISLDDYRTRHAQYKEDEDLQAAHARAPWICVFDDHEICNNPWKGGAENHNPEQGEGDWLTRKTLAIKAYREWMPIRDPKPGQLTDAIYRSFRFGKIAEMIMVETRLLARSKQLDYTTDLKLIDDKPDYSGFRARLNDPARELFGAEQRNWLAATLQSSVQAGVGWQVLGNQVIMARVAGPDLIKLFGADTVNTILSALPEAPRTQVQSMIGLFSQPDPLPYNLDAWDGYPAERERLYEIIKTSGARAVVVSGDSHTAWANQLHDAANQPVAIELGVTSVTSPTKWFDAWLPNLAFAKTLADQNTEVLAADDSYNGFLRLTLTSEEISGEWMSLSTIISRDFLCTSQATFVAKADAYPSSLSHI